MVLASAEFHTSLDKRYVAITRLHMNRSEPLVQPKSMGKGSSFSFARSGGPPAMPRFEATKWASSCHPPGHQECDSRQRTPVTSPAIPSRLASSGHVHDVPGSLLQGLASSLKTQRGKVLFAELTMNSFPTKVPRHVDETITCKRAKHGGPLHYPGQKGHDGLEIRPKKAAAHQLRC